jgi:pyrroloquinoline quinone biosynthesis protein B
MKRTDLKYIIGLVIVCIIGAGIIIYSVDRSAPLIISKASPFILITGVAQDAGYPQAGCQKSCCQKAYNHEAKPRYPVSLSIIEPSVGWWMIEATPDLKFQLEMSLRQIPDQTHPLPTGIFITHAHIGHYTGLMHFGKEVIGADSQQVYVLPKMLDFLNKNGPWNQLVELENILLNPIQFDQPTQLSKRIRVTPIQVPHRDEYSETAGFYIEGPSKSALFIPDIDKWSKWNQDIVEWVKKVDYALIDATFFDADELPGRDMSQIPHPFVVESMELLDTLSPSEKKKVIFIHLNHTNFLLDPSSKAYKQVIKNGYKIAAQGQKLTL